MKFLFDENISYRIVKKVSALAAESIHVSRSGLDMPAKDQSIWAFARDNDFVIVSFDEDFQDLSMINGFPPKVILLRSGNLMTQVIADIFVQKWQDICDFCESESYGLLEIF